MRNDPVRVQRSALTYLTAVVLLGCRESEMSPKAPMRAGTDQLGRALNGLDKALPRDMLGLRVVRGHSVSLLSVAPERKNSRRDCKTGFD